MEDTKGYYTPHTEDEVKSMLEVIGVKSLEDLFGDIKSENRPASFNIPEGRSEQEVGAYFRRLASLNCPGIVSFLGAGFYDHYIPSIVNALSSRSEFYTAYTPYQPESSQGTLQAIYEYQSVICALTGLEVANASLYDGGTGLYEAVMMAYRATGKKKIVISEGANPVYRSMLRTYTRNLEFRLVEVPLEKGRDSREALFKALDAETAACVLQNPNFLGAIDDHTDIISRAHDVGALAIESVYPISLGILKTPGEMGADIAVGEGQSLGMPLSFGGPYLGFMASKKKLARKMPGRIAGATVDRDGRRGFVLTLQAREQHIRRQKATSNICSNQALCALRAVVYLSALGRSGFRRLAVLNRDLAEYAKSGLSAIKGVRLEDGVSNFNEFTVTLPKAAGEVFEKMIVSNYLAGLPLSKYYKGMDDKLLVAVTESRTKEEIDGYVRHMEKALWS